MSQIIKEILQICEDHPAWTGRMIGEHIRQRYNIPHEPDTAKKEELLKRIQDYLIMGGLFNPELAIHDNVRDLLIEIREELKCQKSK